MPSSTSQRDSVQISRISNNKDNQMFCHLRRALLDNSHRYRIHCKDSKYKLIPISIRLATVIWETRKRKRRQASCEVIYARIPLSQPIPRDLATVKVRIAITKPSSNTRMQTSTTPNSLLLHTRAVQLPILVSLRKVLWLRLAVYSSDTWDSKEKRMLHRERSRQCQSSK